MKSTILLVLGLCCGMALTAIYLGHRKGSPVPAPVPAASADTSPEPVAPQETTSAPARTTPAAVEVAPEPTPVDASTPKAAETESESVIALRKTIDALLAPQFSGQKQELFDRLRTSGQIDAAITELQSRAKENPGDANIHTTLGEAMLNKVRLLHETGADINEQGILAMQADQSFNAALKADPTSWEAQFVKYSTMFYWPADPKRDNEAAQKLSGLIDQQETKPLQPHFAQTYIALGNQYQKMGKSDFAEATWRLGLAKFPNDPVLRQKLAGR